jgi:hypothetical protein
VYDFDLNSKQALLLAFIILASIFIVAAPVFQVSVIKSEEFTVPTEIQTAYNVSIPYEIEETYWELSPVEVKVPFKKNETITKTLIDYAKRITLSPDGYKSYYFNLSTNENVDFYVKIGHTADLFRLSIIDNKNFDLYQDGDESQLESTQLFKGNGTLQYTCLYNDTYYFIIENVEIYDINIEEVSINITWEEEEMSHKTEIKYINETKQITKVEYKIETRYESEIRNVTNTRQILVPKKVTLLSILLKTY